MLNLTSSQESEKQTMRDCFFPHQTGKIVKTQGKC